MRLLPDTQVWLWMHPDPTRLRRDLVAQAQIEKIPLVTADRHIPRDDVEVLLAR